MVLREVAIKKLAATPLSSCRGIVQDPPHREVNARTDGYPCQMDSVQSLYGMTAEHAASIDYQQTLPLQLLNRVLVSRKFFGSDIKESSRNILAQLRWSLRFLLLLVFLGLQGCAVNGVKPGDSPANEALLQAVGNHSGLVALYRQRLAEAVDPVEQDDNRLKLAEAYLASGDPESALFYCQPVIDAERNPGDCLLVKSRALLASGDHQDALVAAQAALALRENDAVILNQLGLVYADAGNYDDARTQFNRARELMLDDVTARNNLAMVDILEQQWDQAADRLMPLFRSGQADDKVSANLLLALARSGRVQEFMAVCGRKGQTCQEYYHALSGAGRRDGQ